MDKQFFRNAGQYALAWLKRHKLATVIAVLLLLALFWPKSTPRLKGVEAMPPATPSPSASVAAVALPTSTTKPASTQPVSPQNAADFLLYSPNGAGADPSWSLPAELKADDLQRLARQVDKLAQDIPTTAQLEQQCEEGANQIFQPELIGLFWKRLMGPGFHDANLPLDWYEAVKEKNSILGDFTAIAERFTNAMVQNVIAMRLASVQVRIIGGRVLIGDVLFVKSSQAYINQRKPYFERLLPLVRSVSGRMQQEFRNELHQQPRRG